MGKITLVLGGIKCGKTSYAEKLASDRESRGGEILYLATAEALDDEMKHRIDRHRADRPKNWDTAEEPLDVKSIFEKKGNVYDLILFDCLTLWITNKIGQAGENYIREELMDNIISSCKEFISQIKDIEAEVVIVSNQVEVGLISPYPLGRVFQDIAGLLHQEIARSANKVVVMQAGIPTILKEDV
ncbi:MAG: bifunctional adenosylcobinamide kinase/adenosylcobinamide-phosphate guanylyltransferase [Spirochaetaceae bacterium]